jgi:hypothetical protein
LERLKQHVKLCFWLYWVVLQEFSFRPGILKQLGIVQSGDLTVESYAWISIWGKYFSGTVEQCKIIE